MPDLPLDKTLACVEDGHWTSALVQSAPLHFKDIDDDENEKIKKADKVTFHMVGCTGDPENPEPQDAVTRAMVSQLKKPDSDDDGLAAPRAASFFYHLGDIVYKPEDDTKNGKPSTIDNDQTKLYHDEFYAAYSAYDRKIFAIAGNHDGKIHLDKVTGKLEKKKSPLIHFHDSFCSPKPVAAGDNPDNLDADPNRETMTQPHLYWTLETPAASIIGLYTNVMNGGQLDAPNDSYQPQYHWLVKELKRLRKDGANKPLLIACHYPPYSGAANFLQRGNPNLSASPRFKDKVLKPLATLLQMAYDESGARPDAVFSAHAHLYQRITYTCADGYQIPYVVAGCGGHDPVEALSETCSKDTGPAPAPPLPVICPPGLAIPSGDNAIVVNYSDRDFGFLRITVDKETLRCEFHAVPVAAIAARATYPPGPSPTTGAFLYDQFTLALNPKEHEVHNG